uniref:Protein FAM136A n=1 Tax=Elaeophora elaphi TaxID=1147741 RepID=A0A0R3RW08_9BILA
MFLCSSDCYDRSLNRDIVETCVEGCNKPVKNATSILQKELDDLQAQLNRCGMTCFDKAAQKFGPYPVHYTEIQSREFDKQLLNCACSCVDDHIKLLPNIRKRLVNSYERFLK